MASSPLPSSTRQKNSDNQLGKLLSIQNKLICYDRKKPASNDEEEKMIAEFETALKEMNVSDMSEPEQTMLIKKYNMCYQRLNSKKGRKGQTEPDVKLILGIVSDCWAPKTDLICISKTIVQTMRQSIRCMAIRMALATIGTAVC
jgi:hypothetical protein